MANKGSGRKVILNNEVVPVEFSRCEDDSTATQRKYATVPGKEKNAGSLTRDHLDDSLCQNLRFMPESSKAPVRGISTKFTESNLQLPSLEPVTVSSNLPKSNSLCGKGLQLFDSCISDCTSVTKTSVIPVIRQPIFGTSFPLQDTVASESVDIGDITSVNKRDVSSYNQTIEKEPLLPPNSEVKEGFLDANHLGFHTSRNDQRICSPASSLAKLHSKNLLNHGIKVRGGQIPDINVPHGSTMSVDSTEAFKHTTNITENSDNYNPAVDSPCWKGAPASNVSPFNFLEAIPPQNHSKKLETRDLLDFEAVQKFPPFNEFVMNFSSQVCGPSLRKENLSTDNAKAVLPMKNLNATLPAKEPSAADDAKLKSDIIQQNRNIGDQYSSNVESPIKLYNLINSSKSDSCSVQSQAKQPCPKEVNITPNMAGAVDAGISSSDTLEDGCIPLHYVENVLYSPPSEEDDGQPPATESQKVNVQTLASALHNISELLLLYSFDDEWELKEQDSKTLEHAVRNINLCLSKKIVQLTPKQEPIVSNAGISSIPEEGATQLRLHTMDEVCNTKVDHLDPYSAQQKERILGVSDKRIEKNRDFVSPSNDADVTRHHNMVQNIKKALDENIQLEEDISSEALLYKNLWLNAEAELCVTGLKSRFDKVKIQLEDFKSDETKENSGALKKIPSSNITPDPCLDVASGLTPEANDRLKQTSVPYISSTSSDVNDDEASVMARLQILKCRGDNKNTTSVEKKSLPDVQPDDTVVKDVDDSVMARFQILKCRGDNMNTSNVEENSLLDLVQPDDTDVNDVEDSVMAGFQILKCQGDGINTSNVEGKSLPDVVQSEGTDFGVPWQIVGSQTGNKSFDVAVGSRIHPHSDNGNAKNVGSSPYDPKHKTMKEFSVYASDDANTIQPRRNISMHDELASGSGWHKNSPSDGLYSATIQPHISMPNELASNWDNSGSGWCKNTPSDWDDSGSSWLKSTQSDWGDIGSVWRKNTPSDWDNSTTIQPCRNISVHNELAPGSGWHKNTPSNWDDSATIQPRRNNSMHNELASGSGWYENTPLDWEHVLKDDYEWQK